MHGAAVRCSRALPKVFATVPARQYSSTPSAKLDVNQLLANPTWSVSSLLPKDSVAQEVTSKKLRHLLRLSALPPPKDSAEEGKMLATLSSQLHFVKDIQEVDTTGVEPLKSLRDETREGRSGAELGMDRMKNALQKEEIRGRFHKRIRRKRSMDADKKEPEWDVLGLAERRVGSYFVVDGGKTKG